MLLKARWIIPVSSPPIENGAIAIRENKISYVGAQFIAPGDTIMDLGDSILFPGLVNAHAHLEFSQTTQPTKSFTEWARALPPSPQPSPARGEGVPIDALIRGGTTTVADHCSSDTLPLQTPFRRIIFWEVLGAGFDRATQSFQRALKRAAEEGGFVAPHSLYGVHPDILEKISSPLQSIHLLESADEDQFLRHGTGPLSDFVKERGGNVGAQFIAPGFFTRLIRERPNTLFIHANYLQSQEIEALRGTGASVIHCPGSHRFFGHKKFPYEDLKQADVHIGLGTDSLASNDELSMLREMRLFQESYPDVPFEEILRMATIEGAKALKMEKEIGSIEIGKKADLVAVRVGAYCNTPLQGILDANEVSFSMIDGKVILPPL